MKNKIIAGVILVLIGFGSGFVPLYKRLRLSTQEIGELKVALEKERTARALADLRNSAALLHVELLKNNFSVAGERATIFFDTLRRFSEQAPEPIRGKLQGVLARRDALTAAIARADPGAATLIQQTFSDLQAL